MLAALDSDQKRVDAVVITDFDRLSRDPLVRERFVRRLQHKGADIVSISKSPAPDTAADFASAILRVVEEHQSEEISRRTLRCMCEAARQGRWTGSTPPFGFRTVPAEARGKERGKRLEIHAGEARTVRRIFDLYLKGDGNGGMSSGAIADRLNERGVRFRNGGRFDERKVRCNLFREICAGRRSFNRKVGRSGKLKDRSDWVLVAVPAIVSRAVYERAQKDRRRRIRNDARTRWRPSKSRRS
jgi:DNA invertase Pin-like site-specific DNA recombinase